MTTDPKDKKIDANDNEIHTEELDDVSGGNCPSPRFVADDPIVDVSG